MTPELTSPLPSQGSEITLREMIDIFRRRKLIIIQTLVVILVISALITFLTKPTYRASTRLLVEGERYTMAQVSGNDPLGSLFLPSTGYNVATQIEVLQSDKVISDTLQATGIPRDRVSTRVKQVGETNVVEVQVDSKSPEYAERFAKTIPGIYLSYIQNNSEGQVVNARKYVRKQLDEENKALLAAEAKMDRYRRTRKFVDVNLEKTELMQQRTQVEAELRSAIADVAGAQGRLDQLLEARSKVSDYIETESETTNQVQIEMQRDKIAQKEAEREQLLILHKPGSPAIDQVDAQIKAMRERLAQIPQVVKTRQKARNTQATSLDDKIVEARAVLTANKARLQDVQRRAEQSKSGLDKVSRVEFSVAALGREIEQRREAVKMLAASLQQLQLRERATHDPVQVIEAVDGVIKVSPRPITNMILALLLGLFLGIGFALLQDFLDDRINSPDEARLITGVTALGYIPMTERQEQRLITDLSGGSMLESFRVLRSNVQFASLDLDGATSIMVTSATPGEGKSTTACNLATVMALDGRSVILVDTDLRLPTIHEKMGVMQQPGLTTVLLGRVALEDALQETTVENLRVLAAGALPPNPAEILNSSAMRQLIEDLKAHADYIIFDAPPTLATADAQVLSAITDGVVFVMHLGNTKKSGARHSFEMLRRAQARILGVVFNKLDQSSNRDNYYYSYGGYYYAAGNGKSGRNGKMTTPHANGNGSDSLVTKNGSSTGEEVALNPTSEKSKGRKHS